MPLDPNHGIYYEEQVGGLCRMHALNAFFGYGKISREVFTEHARSYDKFIVKKFGMGLPSLSYDSIGSDQTSLVSYILNMHGVCSRYYSPNSLYGATIELGDLKLAPFIFIYNAGHIWGVRKKGTTHYRIDSINGVSKYHFPDVATIPNIGFILPTPPKQEWNYQLSVLDRILDANNIKTRSHLQKYLLQLHAEKKILGDMEVPLGVAISILEMKLSRHSTLLHRFEKIGQLIKDYNAFTSTLSAGRYNDSHLIVSTVPDLIFDLYKLRQT